MHKKWKNGNKKKIKKKLKKKNLYFQKKKGKVAVFCSALVQNEKEMCLTGEQSAVRHTNTSTRIIVLHDRYIGTQRLFYFGGKKSNYSTGRKQIKNSTGRKILPVENHVHEKRLISIPPIKTENEEKKSWRHRSSEISTGRISLQML